MARKTNSISNVEKEAKELSMQHPDCYYYVIAKKYKGALCYSIDWLAMRKINNEGYYPVCVYKNGKRY